MRCSPYLCPSPRRVRLRRVAAKLKTQVAERRTRRRTPLTTMTISGRGTGEVGITEHLRNGAAGRGDRGIPEWRTVGAGREVTKANMNRGKSGGWGQDAINDALHITMNRGSLRDVTALTRNWRLCSLKSKSMSPNKLVRFFLASS